LIGGVITSQELLALGRSRNDIRSALAAGALRRIRSARFACPHASPGVCRAVEIGGRLTGLSALAEWGCWMWEAPSLLQVAVSRDRGHSVRPAGDALLRWRPVEEQRRGTAGMVAIEDALRRAARDADWEDAVAAFDWALAEGRISRLGLAEVVDSLPLRLKPIGTGADRRSGGLLESVCRARLVARGHRVRTQVVVGPEWVEPWRRKRIDLVIDDVVALETDGREFHAGEFERDRRKDAEIAAAGLRPLRVSYSMVRYEWFTIERAIDSLLGVSA
jgi:very-short-patch-repair endonuclease